MKTVVLAILFVIFGHGETAFAQAWKLEKASFWYRGDHLLQKVDGFSKQAQGFILCKEKCKFALTTPVKSFYAKDQSLNKRIYSALKADEFGDIRITGSSNGLEKDSEFEIRVELAGKSKVYKVKGLNIEKQKKTVLISGNFNFKLSDFGVTPPRVLGFRVKDPVATRFEFVYDLKKLLK